MTVTLLVLQAAAAAAESGGALRAVESGSCARLAEDGVGSPVGSRPYHSSPSVSRT
jgi:hypothetical protein